MCSRLRRRSRQADLITHHVVLSENEQEREEQAMERHDPSTEMKANKALVRRYIEDANNGGDLALVDDLMRRPTMSRMVGQQLEMNSSSSLPGSAPARQIGASSFRTW